MHSKRLRRPPRACAGASGTDRRLNYEKQVAAVQAEIDSCRKIDPERPDAFFNEGILTQEYKAKNAGGTEKAIAVYQKAKQIFQAFLEKASGKSEYDGAVKKTKERMQDIDDTVNFLQAGGPSTPAPAAPPSPAARATAPRHRRARWRSASGVVFGAGKAFGFRGSRASPPAPSRRSERHEQNRARGLGRKEDFVQNLAISGDAMTRELAGSPVSVPSDRFETSW